MIRLATRPDRAGADPHIDAALLQELPGFPERSRRGAAAEILRVAFSHRRMPRELR
jgi:hypothetical protein